MKIKLILTFILLIIIGATTGFSQGSCSPTNIAHWDLDACYFGAGYDYSHFTPFITTPPGFSNVSASVFSSLGGHSCNPGPSGEAICVQSQQACTWIDNSDQALRFSVTVSPSAGEQIRLTDLSFFEKAPINGILTGGQTFLNNPPSKYGIRVLKNGQEIYQEDNITTTIDWTLEQFDLSNDSDFLVNNTATFDFELLGYCYNSADPNLNIVWDVDEINVAACVEPPCSFYTKLVNDNCCTTCITGNVKLKTAFWESNYTTLNAVNLALNKPSDFNENIGTGSAHRATDGLYEGESNTFYDYAYSCAGNYNFWEIDLVGSFDLESINIFTKTGCCAGDAVNYRVFVSTAPFGTANYQTLLNDPNISNFTMPLITNGNTSNLNNVNSFARFVRVYLEGTGQMQLVEVEIIGSGNANSSPYDYIWDVSNIGDTPNPDCLPSGAYQVTVTDNATGCSSMENISLE